MDKFEHAEVVKKANIYYGGKVTSRTVFCEDGQRRTLGFMLEGTYEFSTGAAETMEVLSGAMKVTQEGQPETLYKEGEVFHVPANRKFQAVVEDYTDYCCSYGE